MTWRTSAPGSTAHRISSSARRPRPSSSRHPACATSASRPAIAFRTATRTEQEEVYVVMRGSGRMKLDDEIVELKEWDAVRVPPVHGEVTRPDRRASRSSSSARPVSARLRAKTSMASATGGPTSRARSARPCTTTRRHPRQRPAPDQPRSSAFADGRTPSWSYATRKVPRHGGRVRVGRNLGGKRLGEPRSPLRRT